MALEFQYNLQLNGMTTEKEANAENRKDQREVMKEKNKKEMHREGLQAKKFESSGNDSTKTGIGLGKHEPK